MGSGNTTLRSLIRGYLFIPLFRACAEALASENASRLAAIERADKEPCREFLTLRLTPNCLGGLQHLLRCPRQIGLQGHGIFYVCLEPAQKCDGFISETTE